MHGKLVLRKSLIQSKKKKHHGHSFRRIFCEKSMSVNEWLCSVVKWLLMFADIISKFWILCFCVLELCSLTMFLEQQNQRWMGLEAISGVGRNPSTSADRRSLVGGGHPQQSHRTWSFGRRKSCAQKDSWHRQRWTWVFGAGWGKSCG